MTGTMAELARYLRVARSTITRAVQAGRIRAEADGSFDFGKCAAAWHANAAGRDDVAARHAAQRGADIPTGQPDEKNAPESLDSSAEGIAPGIDIPLNDGGRAKARVLLLHYENSSIKLEMALRRGLRFELEAVRRESAALGAMVRVGIERVIDQTAPRLAAAGNELERRRILTHEIKRLRWVLKREIPRSLRRMKEAGGVSERRGQEE